MNHSGRHKAVHVWLLFGVYKVPEPVDDWLYIADIAE
jgi:hypothetical protein